MNDSGRFSRPFAIAGFIVSLATSPDAFMYFIIVGVICLFVFPFTESR